MKKVLIISTSHRKGGNSDMLAQEFAKGAREAGNEVETVSLAGRRERPRRHRGAQSAGGGIRNGKTIK